MKSSPDLWGTLLLLGCLPSLTNLINVFSMLMLATVPEFAQATKDLRRENGNLEPLYGRATAAKKRKRSIEKTQQTGANIKQ